jgi:hypothetical protein
LQSYYVAETNFGSYVIANESDKANLKAEKMKARQEITSSPCQDGFRSNPLFNPVLNPLEFSSFVL